MDVGMMDGGERSLSHPRLPVSAEMQVSHRPSPAVPRVCTDRKLQEKQPAWDPGRHWSATFPVLGNFCFSDVYFDRFFSFPSFPLFYCPHVSLNEPWILVTEVALSLCFVIELSAAP